MLTWVDYAIGGIIILSVLVSLMRGFLREALSLLSWILAAWVALTFTASFDRVISGFVSVPAPRFILAFVILFVGTLIITALLTYLVSLLTERHPPSLIDRLLATIFGTLRGAFIVTMLVMLASLSAMPQTSAWTDSLLLPRFEHAAQSVRALLPPDVSSLFPE